MESISVVGETEVYLDEFLPDNYVLRVRHTDGWIEDLPLSDHLSEEDKALLQQPGIHTLNVSYGGQSCEFNIVLNLHEFENITLEDSIFIYDGEEKYLEIIGVPEGTEVTWENNGQTEVGEYTVTVTLKKQYYEDLTLTATLSIRKSQYNITYVLGVEDAVNSNPATYNYGEGLTLSSPASGMWEFLGWYSDEDFSSEVTAISTEDYGDKTFYAKWQTIFTYSNGTITGLTEYGRSNATAITIPAEIHGTAITGIGNNAFRYRSRLTDITINEGITSIGEYAFANSSLNSITISASITSIGTYAFFNCGNLTSVTFSKDSQLANISGYAFYSCDSLTRITIPASVTSIGERAFYYCSGLEGVYITDISAWCNIEFGNNSANPLYYAGNLYLNGEPITDLVIPEGTTSIGGYIFYNCDNLTGITLPASVTSIGNRAFYDCNNLETITISGDSQLASIGDYTFYNCVSLTSITIPEGVTSIGNDAFYDCSNLASVIFSGDSQLANISGYAFYNCNSLTNITIPASVTSVGGYAFENCSKLKSVTFSGDSQLTSIGDYAFNYCSGITSITIPEGVTSIGSYAFNNCDSLTCVTFSGDCQLTSIGEYAFYNCDSLTSITIPVNVKSIGSYAFSVNDFYNDSNLETIIFSGGQLTSIGDYAFYNCSDLESVYITDIAAWCNIEFSNASANPLYYVGNLYLNGELVTELVIPEGVTSISSYAFYNCSNLKSVTFSGDSQLTSIGSYAFRGCSGLTSITIPASVAGIGSSAFSGCGGLESITLPFVGGSASAKTASGSTLFGYIFGTSSYTGGVSTLQYYTSSSYVTYYIPATLKNVTITGGNILYGAFYNCGRFTSVTICEGVKTIGSYAFYNCSSLMNITIPASVTSISERAFSSCSILVIYCEVASQPSGWNSYWNSGCPVVWDCNNNKADENDNIYTVIDGLRYRLNNGNATVIEQPSDLSGEIVIVSSIIYNETTYTVTSIEEEAFSYCYYITDITIPSSITSIVSYAFYNCSSLTSIAIPASVTSIGSYAFYNCSSLTSIAIPASVTSIGSYAFYNCNNLTSITIPVGVTFIGKNTFENCGSLTRLVFENANNWFITSSSTATTGIIRFTSLSDPTTAARYLTDTYFGYYWKRR